MTTAIKGLSSKDSASLREAHEELGNYIAMKPPFDTAISPNDAVTNHLEVAGSLLGQVQDPAQVATFARRILQATDLYLPIPESKQHAWTRRENHIGEITRYNASNDALEAWSSAVQKFPTAAQKVEGYLDIARSTEFIENPFIGKRQAEQATSEGYAIVSATPAAERAKLLLTAFKAHDDAAPKRDYKEHRTEALTSAAHTMASSLYMKDVVAVPTDTLRDIAKASAKANADTTALASLHGVVAGILEHRDTAAAIPTRSTPVRTAPQQRHQNG